MKANIFTNELAKTSSVFGRKKNIEVVFDGDGAATNGNKVKLPAIDLNADVTEEQAAIMRGYVDHEAGHVRHTDFDVLKRNAEKLKGNKLLHSCANALEDVWLESKVREEYPGSEINLRATSEAVNKEFIASVPEDDARLGDPVFVGPVSVTWAGRESYGGDTNEQCLNLIDHDIAAMAREYAERVLGCKNSGEVFSLAEELEARIRSESGSETGESDAEDGEADGEMGDGEWRGHQPDVDGTDKPEGSDVSEGDKPDDGDGDGDTAEGDAAVDDVYDQFGSDVALKSIQGALTGTGRGSYRVLSTEFDRWWHRNDEPSKYGRKHRYNLGHYVMSKYDAEVYDRVLASMSGTINMLRRKLERALISKQTRDWDVAKEHGRLDTKRLTAAVAGRQNVFKVRTDRQDMDTAVSLLIDLSGSMSGTPIHTARQCAIAIAEAIDRTGIKYEMLGFVNDFYGEIHPELRKRVDEIVGKDEEREWGRLQPLNMAVFKQFNERLFEAKGSIASMVDLAIGDNTDGEAVQLAFDRLQDRPEKRKVMMVLSDGYPAAMSSMVKMRDHLRRVVSDIEDSGTDIVGIGIQSEAVNHFYTNHVVVHRISDLEGEVMGQLSKILLGERVELDHSKLIDRAV